MYIELNQQILDWFEERNISFHNNFGVRLRPGDCINFREGLNVEPYIGIHGGNTISSMGFMSYTNSDVPPDLEIGRYCSLAANLRFPRHRHPMEHVSTSIFTHETETDLVLRFIRDYRQNYQNFFPNPQKGSVTLGHDVWVGEAASIMPGLTIGTGAVVAASSVVTRAVPPYAIVGGNPARIIRMRFSDEIIRELLISEWWKYKFTDFAEMDISSPRQFIDSFNRAKRSLAEYRPQKINLADILSLCD